ncbi:hypothetical protein MMC10_009694 [Thelotrema lepadinum]|nr:hypothetical protein [Thelotrema lepadinum]
MLGRDIKIKLDGGNDQAFFPGAPIHGTLTYKASADDRLTSVNLDLRGVIKISPTKTGRSAAANEGKTQTEHVELFHMFEKILPEPIWTERKAWNWNFTMVIPEFTGQDRSSMVYADTGNPLFEETPHHLPPNMGRDQSSEVQILYHMYAVAKRSFRGYGAAEELQEAPVVDNIHSLICFPDPPLPSSSPMTSTEKEWELIPTAPKPRRFSLKPSSTSNSLEQGAAGGPPTVVSAIIPTQLFLGEPINVTLQLSSRSDEEDRPSIPVLYKQMAASLRALTHRRTTKVPHNSQLTETNTKKLGSDMNKATPALSSEPVSISFWTAAVKDWPPTFKTYCVSRIYELIVEVVVFKGKEEFKTQFEVEVEVMRKLSEEDRVRRTSVAPPSLPVLGPRGDEELPGYMPRNGDVPRYA